MKPQSLQECLEWLDEANDPVSGPVHQLYLKSKPSQQLPSIPRNLPPTPSPSAWSRRINRKARRGVVIFRGSKAEG